MVYVEICYITHGTYTKFPEITILSHGNEYLKWQGAK